MRVACWSASASILCHATRGSLTAHSLTIHVAPVEMMNNPPLGYKDPDKQLKKVRPQWVVNPRPSDGTSLIDIATAPATKHALRPQTARPRSLPRGPKRSSKSRIVPISWRRLLPPCAQPSVLSPHADSSSTVTGSCCQSLDASSAMPSSLRSELRQGRCVALTDGYRPCPVFAALPRAQHWPASASHELSLSPI